MKKILFVLAPLVLIASCSSVKSRIEQNPEEFSKLTPEQQQQVQSGVVQPGYTPEMVSLAKGEPSEKRTRRDGAKTIMIWTYRKPQIAEPANKSRDTGFAGAYNGPNWGSGPSSPTPLIYGGGAQVVEFENGRVRRVSP